MYSGYKILFMHQYHIIVSYCIFIYLYLYVIMSTSTDDISDLEKYAIPDAVKQYYEEFDKHKKAI